MKPDNQDHFLMALMQTRAGAGRSDILALLRAAIVVKTESLIAVRADGLVAAQAQVHALQELHDALMDENVPQRQPNTYL